MPRNPHNTDDSQGFSERFELFASIDDPRDGGHTLHHFGEIFFIAFVGVLCGVRSYELMEGFGEPRENWLRKWLKLPNGIPCANTSSRIFQAMEGGQIAIDGKGTQRTIAGKIVQKGGHDILSVKGNPGRLHDEVRDQLTFALRQLDPARLDAQRWSSAQTKDSGHDRSETRQIMAFHDLS